MNVTMNSVLKGHFKMKPFEDFVKVVRLGTVQGWRKNHSVFCKISFKNSRLSICGVIGPTISGNAQGCGQIEMSLKKTDFQNFGKGWDQKLVDKFLNVWRKWHLNDMKAGTPRQMKFLEKQTFDPNVHGDHYSWARKILSENNLNPDVYKGKSRLYGSSWFKINVPKNVLAWLKNLPDTDRKPAWV